jgi:hypothetical protein
MKARTAFIALALFSAQASAEWQFIVKDSSGTDYFIDLSTKRQQGQYTLVWEMVDYSKAQQWNGKSFNSVKQLSVYQCSELRLGGKSSVLYSGKLGMGNTVHNQSQEMRDVKFDDLVPDTVGETLFNIVCGKG